MQPSLFDMKRLRLKCKAAQCGEPAAPAETLCPPHLAGQRNGLMARCLGCQRWMDHPAYWGYNCEDCAGQQSEKVNRRLKDQHGGALFNRQQGKCSLCRQPIAIGRGRLPGDAQVDLDHIKPRVLGGRDNLENLQLLHRTCNRRKGAMAMVEYRAWAEAPLLPL